MQITVPRGELKEAVGGFSKIVNGKSHTLPILGCVRFENNGHGITGSVTDLDQHLRYQFSGAQAQGDGSFILPLASLKELAKGKDTETVEFETAKDNAVFVTNHVGAHAVKHQVAGIDPEEWPVGPAEIETKPAQGFLDTYRKLVPFASTDQSRYLLNSVYIDTQGTGDKPVTMVACDGRRMTCQNSMNLPIAHPTIVPLTKFLSWNGLQGDGSIGIRTMIEKAKKKKEEDQVRVLGFVLSAGPWYFDCKAVDGQFPNWRQVIPSDQDVPNRITFTDEDVTALRKILPTFPGANTHSQMIALKPGPDGRLVISGRGVDDKDETTLELTGRSTFTGTLQGFGLNALFLLDALEAGFRAFTALDELCPLKSEDGKGGTHLLMPMRLGAETAKPPEAKPEPEPEQEPSNDNNTAVAEAPAEDNKEGASKRMTKETNGNGTTEQGTALDKVLTAVETAKAKVKDAVASLSEVADAVKLAVKEGKAQASDLEKARTTLQKLQAMSL